MSIILHAHAAAELAERLATIEDWLLHADAYILHELADFAFRPCYRPAAAVEALIDDLGHYSVLLRGTHNTDNRDTTKENQP